MSDYELEALDAVCPSSYPVGRAIHKQGLQRCCGLFLLFLSLVSFLELVQQALALFYIFYPLARRHSLICKKMKSNEKY